MQIEPEVAKALKIRGNLMNLLPSTLQDMGTNRFPVWAC